MKYFEKFMDNIENYICIITFTIMLTLTFVNVVSRFGLHMSLSFTEEIVTGLFVLASLTGSSIAVRKEAHLGLDFFTSFLPKKGQDFLLIVATLAAMAFCIILFYFGVQMVIQEYVTKQVSATMQWPEWIYGMTVPVGSALLILRYIITLKNQIVKFTKKGDGTV